MRSVRQAYAQSGDSGIISIGNICAPIPPIGELGRDWRSDSEGSPHFQTTCLHLRKPVADTPEEVFDGLLSVTTEHCTEEWQDVLCEICFIVGGAGIGRAMLVSLPPHGEVLPHFDSGTYCARHDRYHLPIRTNDDCFLKVGEEAKHLRQYCLYYIDNKSVHSAWNKGETERLHLIVDILPF